ncbi:hypothetical protein HDU96_005964 [Phlyctochytrium bullatum]|nr:hypothetical protein HDU96_005964 [Phlyctochytrium bullatum]
MHRHLRNARGTSRQASLLDSHKFHKELMEQTAAKKPRSIFSDASLVTLFVLVRDAVKQNPTLRPRSRQMPWQEIADALNKKHGTQITSNQARVRVENSYSVWRLSKSKNETRNGVYWQLMDEVFGADCLHVHAVDAIGEEETENNSVAGCELQTRDEPLISPPRKHSPSPEITEVAVTDEHVKSTAAAISEPASDSVEVPSCADNAPMQNMTWPETDPERRAIVRHAVKVLQSRSDSDLSYGEITNFMNKTYQKKLTASQVKEQMTLAKCDWWKARARKQQLEPGYLSDLRYLFEEDAAAPAVTDTAPEDSTAAISAESPQSRPKSRKRLRAKSVDDKDRPASGSLPLAKRQRRSSAEEITDNDEPNNGSVEVRSVKWNKAMCVDLLKCKVNGAASNSDSPYDPMLERYGLTLLQVRDKLANLKKQYGTTKQARKSRVLWSWMERAFGSESIDALHSSSQDIVGSDATRETADSMDSMNEVSKASVSSPEVDCSREISSQASSVSANAADSGDDGPQLLAIPAGVDPCSCMSSKLHKELDLLRVDLHQLQNTQDHILRRVQAAEEALLALAYWQTDVNFQQSTIDNRVATLERQLPAITKQQHRPRRSIHENFNVQEAQIDECSSMFEREERAYAGRKNILSLLRNDMAQMKFKSELSEL